MDKRWKKALILLLGIAILVLLRKVLGRIALLLLVSATLAYLMHPVAGVFRKKMKMGEGFATAAAFALVGCVLIVLLVFGAPALMRRVTALGKAAPALMRSYMEMVNGALGRLTRLGVPDEALDFARDQAGTLLSRGAQFLLDKLMTVAGGVSRMGFLVFSPVLAFYMLRDRKRLFGFLTRMIPSRVRRDVLKVTLSVRESLAAYAGGQVLVSLCTGGMTAVGLLILGIPAWLPLGLTMMACNLIPYFGPWLGAIPILLFALGEGWGKVLGAAAVVVVAQQAESLFVSPRVIGEAASLHPAQVMLSLMLGGWIAGLAGMFYAIPVAVCVKAGLRAVWEVRCGCGRK